MVQYLGDLGGEHIVVKNDEKTVEEIKQLQPCGILISPGPGINVWALLHCPSCYPALLDKPSRTCYSRKGCSIFAWMLACCVTTCQDPESSSALWYPARCLTFAFAQSAVALRADPVAQEDTLPALSKMHSLHLCCAQTEQQQQCCICLDNRHAFMLVETMQMFHKIALKPSGAAQLRKTACRSTNDKVRHRISEA